MTAESPCGPDSGGCKPPIVVLDSAWVGHVPIYHREVCRAFLDLGHVVHSVAPEARERDRERDRVVGRVENLWMRRWRPVPATEKPEVIWREVRSHLDEVAGQHARAPLAYFPWVDFGFLKPDLSLEWLDREMPYVWGGLVLRPCARRPGVFCPSARRERLLRSNGCSGVHLLNEDMCGYYEQFLAGKYVGVFPDVTDLGTDSSQRLFHGLVVSGGMEPTFTFPGNICARKGFDWFVEAAHRAKKRGLRWRFFAIGAFSLGTVSSPREYRRLLRLLERRPGVSMAAFPTRVPDADINAVLKESAGVWCHYRDFPWSSNVMVKAAGFAVPLLAASEGVIGKRVQRYELGEASAEGNEEAIDRALVKLADPDWRSAWRARQRCAEFARLHAVDRVRDALAPWLTASLARYREVSQG